MTAMYRMLLVDDEDYVLEGMRDVLNWNKLRIEIVGTARDGAQALDLLQQVPADILVTDIMMPNVNGIELIEQISNMRLNMQIVVLTAYSDFEYTKQAIRFRVFDYLLKPVVVQSIREVFKRLVTELDHQRADDERKSRLDSGLRKLHEAYYFECIRGLDAPKPASLRVEPKAYLVAILAADDERRGPTAAAMYDLLQGRDDELVPVCMNQAELAVVLPMGLPNGAGDSAALLADVQRQMQAHFDVSISMGVGMSQPGAGGLRSSFLAAEGALAKRLLRGDGALIDCRPLERADPARLEALKSEAVRSAELLDMKKVSAALAAIQAELRADPAYELEDLHQLYTQLVLVLQEMGKRTQGSQQEFLGYCAQLLHELYRAKSLADLFGRLESGYDLLVRELSGGRASMKNQRAVRAVTNYVRDNLNTQLSLGKLAGAMGLTPNYLGLIFRQDMGLSFNEYVAHVRIEEAMRLLSESRYKVYEVAAMVGYKNTNYFSKLFTEHAGKSPSEYRA